ncbi:MULTISPECIES: hypothetical protein [Alphaproteobacteria]|uniref:Uncharacterized protein n=2 Tax=Alphaproteobacteria TaxID=28211 RepID=A0A512HHI6_9HYPH|nr:MULTISPECIES: hypothetical protein [Alphaproteobacteria]GEO84911.1 hypothetical protein RNA01_18430 [Ciceribacter naphthalenivorans]GLR22845.1 hypothetical protein GCM10007920_26330 [Ciceribacter naphthalenivorans]GLT05701.1 hypothetical protein GCM10007926_26330 [Sphingomonas psychrolutea]
MIPKGECDLTSGHGRAGIERWWLGGDDAEGTCNWAVILLYVSLMPVPFVLVAWLLS